MKYENFEEAKKLAEEIEELKKTRNDLSRTNRVTFADSREDLQRIYIPGEEKFANRLAEKMLVELIAEYDRTIEVLKRQFESL